MMKGAMMKFVIILVCLTMGLLLLWERNTLVQLGLEIQQLQSTQKDLRQAQHELLIEISSLSSYQRIEEIATTQMGMIRPDPHQVVKVLNHAPVKQEENKKDFIRVAER
jgi:cell division protein FtsL